jgi:ferritin-like metal-binding protein YciE
MSMKTLNDKFVHDLGDIYDAEHRFLEAQQQMHEMANARELKTMIKEHIAQTEQQIANLEQAYEMVGMKPKRVKCDAAAGLVIEGEKGMKEAKDNPAVLDVVIASAAAKVEHYEIASYRGLIAECQQMGQNDLCGIFEQNLAQEEQTAQKVESSMPMMLQKAA